MVMDIWFASILIHQCRIAVDKKVDKKVTRKWTRKWTRKSFSPHSGKNKIELMGGNYHKV